MVLALPVCEPTDPVVVIGPVVELLTVGPVGTLFVVLGLARVLACAASGLITVVSPSVAAAAIPAAATVMERTFFARCSGPSFISNNLSTSSCHY